MPPTAPANPPSPTTDATALRGNVSETSVYKLADQPWCAAAASAMRATAGHSVFTNNSAITGTGAQAQISMAVFRAALADQPCEANTLERQPPPMEPTSAAT